MQSNCGQGDGAGLLELRALACLFVLDTKIVIKRVLALLLVEKVSLLLRSLIIVASDFMHNSIKQ